jgi:hypothetical protein
MSTLMICPVCKGVRAGAAGSALGRRCTCSSGPVASSSDSSGGGTAVATKPKVCSVCGTDVTEKKRMKDGTTGRYWCYDCYLIEQRKKQPSGMLMRCPHCHKDYPPVQMIKHGDTWWCQTCEEERQSKGKKKPANVAGAVATASETRRHTGYAAADGARSGSAKLYVFAGLAAAAVAAYWYFLM